ncbi:threonine synthase [Halobacillus campisalis]|uniref:Threonine synthase n=1 Tax=Halobacillus campisalis TaxID=435909 RepID=A0ABW2K7Z3_9BACI|nr:threonine synthase [Halobacillus campisalis]
MSVDYLFIDESLNEYTPDKHQWRPKSGLFNVKPYKTSFPLEKIKTRSASLWRYKEALPFRKDEYFSSLTLGEGMTPLVSFNSTEPNLLMKMDYLMPTGSFKDRGAAVLIAKALELGVTSVIADSSGNAGTSIAAYCARANMNCHIYVPDSTSQKKLGQIEAHGAQIHKVSGSREAAALAAMKAVEAEHKFYASHVYNPFFYEGTKTFAFEIWEQLGFQLPDTVVLPVGNGTLLLGAFIGFKNLKEAEATDKIPKIIGVQAEGCAPIAKAIRNNLNVSAVKNKGTQAEGIAIADPARGNQVSAAVKSTGGNIVTAPEEGIDAAQKELAQRGFFVEPTTAATYAAFNKYRDSITTVDDVVVMSLCGSGLKK